MKLNNVSLATAAAANASPLTKRKLHYIFHWKVYAGESVFEYGSGNNR